MRIRNLSSIQVCVLRKNNGGNTKYVHLFRYSFCLQLYLK